MTASDDSGDRLATADLLYGIAGLLATAQEVLPGLVEEGRSKIEPELRRARLLGELAVSFGSQELRRRGKTAFERFQQRDGDGGPVAPVAEPLEPAVAEPTPAEVAQVAAIVEDYDNLTAADVVRLLDGLSPQERAVLARYEAATRGRRTILSRLAQLDGATDSTS